MPTRSVYHVALDAATIEGATIALLPGDPARVPHIAQSTPFAHGRELAWKREFRTWLTMVNDTAVLVTSTGIGGPSASIAIDELAQLGIRTFIRVGTTGGIQPDLEVGTVVVTTGAVRLEGASTNYAPIEYPAVADYRIVAALVEAGRQLGVPCRPGVSCTTDTFYPGQERFDSFSGYVPRRFQGATEEWRRLRVLNYEMEAATLLTMCTSMGLRAGCVSGIVVNRARSEFVSPEGLERGERNAIAVACHGAALLVAAETPEEPA